MVVVADKDENLKLFAMSSKCVIGRRKLPLSSRNEPYSAIRSSKGK